MNRALVISLNQISFSITSNAITKFNVVTVLDESVIITHELVVLINKLVILLIPKYLVISLTN